MATDNDGAKLEDEPVPSPATSEGVSDVSVDGTEEGEYGAEQRIRRGQNQKRDAAIAQGVLHLINLGFWLSVVFAVALAALVATSVWVAAVHILYPHNGWLTLQEQSRITTGFFPAMLVSNAWLIWYASRSRR